MARLKVASYNIHGAIGRDGRYSSQRIRDVVHTLDADVIAIQEVNNRIGEQNLLDDLVGGSALRYIEGPTLLTNSTRYGNALLTRLPVSEVQRLDLSVPGREPRGAISARLMLGAHPLRVIATHLGLRPTERRQQTQRLLGWMDPPQINDAGTTLLMGDINEWFLWGRPIRWLTAYFGHRVSVRTFPARWPLFALDRIWVHPAHRLRHTATVDNALTRVASDHLPIVAELFIDGSA